MKHIDIADMHMTDIVLGTDGYGERISTDTAVEILDYYIGCGGNVIDTARLYTGGMSESIIGAFLQKNKLRSKVYISTKCSHPPLDNMAQHRLTKEDIENDIDASLKALMTDTIDIVWLHRDDINVPAEPVIDALNVMIQKGKIRHFGASNWTHDRIITANNYAAKSGQKGFVASQILYNMATCNQSWDDTLVIAEGDEKLRYDKSKIPVFAFCSQAKGFFEKYHTNTLSEKAIRRYKNQSTIDTYEKILKQAQLSGNTISYTALEMLKNQSEFPVLPIIGPSSVQQLKSTLNISQN